MRMSTIPSYTPPLFPQRPRALEPLAAPKPAGGVTATNSASATPDAGSPVEDAAGGGRETTSSTLGPAALNDRIVGLLAQQVAGGSLTSAQADTLKTALGAVETGGSRHRPSGPPPGPPPQADTDDATTGTLETAASPSSSAPSAGDLLASFVKQLQSAQDRTSTYRADGARSSGQTASALLLNFKA